MGYEDISSRHHRKAEFWLFRIEQCRIFLEKKDLKIYIMPESDVMVRAKEKLIIKDLKKNLNCYMKQWSKFLRSCY